MRKKLGGDSDGIADPDRAKGYSSTRSWGQKEGEDVQNDGICLPDCYMEWSPALLEMADHLPAHGSGE